ncbi:Odorant-Hypothetical protein protein [Nesidiocoris tenuis]|uniref:Uncharacterized protein n=1 Tax=Nesidiocoris tenuis TaxID=355587 RepID=A0ABN7B8V9_9HEMI|nr:Odorant-Hypothetical protein protein [Nesidiocoris tenuis]
MTQFRIFLAAGAIICWAYQAAAAGMFDYSNQCVSMSGITPDSAKSIQEGNLPTTMREKCYVACILRSIQVVDSGGKVSVNNAHLLIDMYSTESAEAKAKTKKTVAECAKEANVAKGRCEVSYQMMSCVLSKKTTKTPQTRTITITLPQTVTIQLPPLSFTLLSIG